MRTQPQLRVRAGEEGYLLVGAIVAIFLVLLALSIAAPTVAKELQRDREVEAEHRANQYVRAIQLYYRKFGHYPGSIDQLKTSNNMKFLRQEYADPFTGKPDWRLIHVGEAKTKVKGFFGQDLPGLPTASLGSASNNLSNGFNANGATGPQTNPFSGPTTTGGSTSSTSTTGGTGTGTNGSGTGPGSSSTGGSGISSQDATTFTGGGAPIMGIGLMKSGDSILVVNEQTNYADWEFLYDPRIEALKAKASLFGGVPSTGLSGLGSASGMQSGTGTPAGGSSSGNGSGTTGSQSGPGTTAPTPLGSSPPQG